MSIQYHLGILLRSSLVPLGYQKTFNGQTYWAMVETGKAALSRWGNHQMCVLSDYLTLNQWLKAVVFKIVEAIVIYDLCKNSIAFMRGSQKPMNSVT